MYMWNFCMNIQSSRMQNDAFRDGIHEMSNTKIAHPEDTWWSISGQERRRQQNVCWVLSLGFWGRWWRKLPGRRGGAAGSRHSSVRRRFCTRAVVPGVGTTFGKPCWALPSVDPLLLPEALVVCEPSVDCWPATTAAAAVSVSERPSENLKQQ